MKKKIIILIALAFLGLTKTNAFTVAFINGYVNNSQTGLSISSHPVIITDSMGYYQVLTTNNYGYYNDSIFNNSSNQVKYYILTYDCSNVLHYDTVTTFGYVFKTSSFSICQSGLDVGIPEFVYLNDTNYITGTYIHPAVVVKNFDVFPVSTFHIAYSINGQPPIVETWNGNPISSNDSIIYSFYNGYSANSNYSICAYTLNNDGNSSNDSVCKNIIMLIPPIDAGVTEFISPAANVNIGDSVAITVRFKNMGNQSISNLQLSYKAYYQVIATENWTGNLPPNGLAVFTFNQKLFINTTTPFKLEAYTQLTNDFNSSNDGDSINVLVNAAPFDVGVIEIINPQTAVCNGNTVSPQITIKNFGTNPLTSIPVKYQRGTQPPVQEIWNGSALQPGATTTYTFVTPFTIPSGTSFGFSAFTNLANDVSTLNDKYSEVIYIYNIPSPITSIMGDDTVIFGQNNVIYTALPIDTNFSTSYIWTFPVGITSNNIIGNSVSINYGNNVQSGNISCKKVNMCGSSLTTILPISVFATPPPPIIYQNGNTLNSGYSSGNQWYYNNVAIAGATQPTYIPTNTGYYYCMVTINGSSSYVSNSIYVAITGIEDAYIKSHFMVYPNPFTDETNFKYSLNKSAVVNLKITDMEGRIIRTLVSEEQSMGEYTYQLNANNLSKGIYFYQFIAGNTSLNGKLIIK